MSDAEAFSTSRRCGLRRFGMFLMLLCLSGCNDRIPITIAQSDPADQLTWATGSVATLHIESPSGIGSAQLRNNAREWPEALDVRLALKALEGFVVRSGNDVYRLEVTADYRALLEPLDSALELRHTPGFGARSGYTVRILPARFAEPSDKLVLEWVDYYR